MSGYSDFADEMMEWYDHIIAYATHDEPHTNLKITIDPLPEVNNVKNASFDSDVIIMQNAAEDQVAVKRALIEIDASPENYNNEWLQFILWEKIQLAMTQVAVDEKTTFIEEVSIPTQLFYQRINPDSIKHLKDYNPLASLPNA